MIAIPRHQAYDFLRLAGGAALAAASLPLFTYPSDLEPSERWFGPGKDTIELTMNRAGLMQVPQESIAAMVSDP